MKNSSKINLILIDDYSMILEGLVNLLSQQKDLNIMARLSSIMQVEQLLKVYYPSSDQKTIALCDLSFKKNPENLTDLDGIDQTGFEIVRMLNNSNKGIRSIIYSMYSSPAIIEKAFSKNVGACGFVQKDSDNQKIFDAIYSVANGNTFFKPDFIEEKKSPPNIFQFFTKKEKLVAQFLLENLDILKIAENLNCSKTEIENYINSIFEKTGTSEFEDLIFVLKENKIETK